MPSVKELFAKFGPFVPAGALGVLAWALPETGRVTPWLADQIVALALWSLVLATVWKWSDNLPNRFSASEPRHIRSLLVGVVGLSLFAGYLFGCVWRRQPLLSATETDWPPMIPGVVAETERSGATPQEMLERTPASSEQVYGGVFRAGSVYPIGFEQLRVGTPLAVLTKIYPAAEFSSAWDTWSVDLAEGPFRRFRCSIGWRVGKDRISSIEFFFRDDAARDHVRARAPAVFGSDAAEASNLGEELEWRDVDGIMVQIDPDRYTLLPARDLSEQSGD